MSFDETTTMACCAATSNDAATTFENAEERTAVHSRAVRVGVVSRHSMPRLGTGVLFAGPSAAYDAADELHGCTRACPANRTPVPGRGGSVDMNTVRSDSGLIDVAQFPT